MRLSDGALADLPADVKRFSYDRAAQKLGIVHFGIGAFHRAHQAVYTDAAMNGGDRDWGIIGVSLRSASVAEQMNPQDGLYTVVARSSTGTEARLIGAVQKVLVASQDAQAVIDAVASADTHIVTFTITEKGYCRAGDGNLDMALANEGSVYRFLKDGLLARRAQGLSGLTLLSCDNLADNGLQLRKLFGQYLAKHDPVLAEWVEANCTFPSSMIDRIVPATTAADLDKAQQVLGGWRDEAHVVTEPFSQWVIEDKFAGPRPNWDAFGAQFVSDVAAYEKMKLRMLNGAHSALAYCGLAKGHEFVHQAMGDPALRALVEQLMFDEAMPTLEQPEAELRSYGQSLMQRFDNPALPHRLIQIAMDGSQKIPQRWLETLAERQARGLQSPALLDVLAAWLVHIKGDGQPVDDPLAGELADAWRVHGRDGIVDALFSPGGLLGGIWAPDAAARAALV